MRRGAGSSPSAATVLATPIPAANGGPSEAHWSGLMTDAKEVIKVLTKEVLRLREKLFETQSTLNEAAERSHLSRVAEVDEVILKSGRAERGYTASPLPNLDNGGALDRGVLAGRITGLESALSDVETQLSRKRKECDKLKEQIKSLTRQREQDEVAFAKLKEQLHQLALQLDERTKQLASSKAKEKSAVDAAARVTQQVKEATQDTIETLQRSLKEALNHNAVLRAELELARIDPQ
jgi:hypothetical protein